MASGEVALVTGGSGGIGLAIARRLGADGWRLCLLDRDAESLAEAGTDLDAVTVTGSVASEPDVVRAVAEAERLGPVAAVVNCAGIAGPTRPMHEITLDEFAEVVDVNLLGTFLVTKHAVGPMLARGRGSIVNIGSVASFEGYPNRTPYCATKWALVGLTRTLAAEYGPSGVRVNLVAPGPTAGERADAVLAARAAANNITFEEERAKLTGAIPLRRLITAEEAAAAVAFLVSDAASGVTGQAIGVTGGMEA